MDKVQIEEHLAEQLPFWNELEKSDQALLVSSCIEARFAEGEQIVGRAAECLGGFVVLEGCVRVYLMSEEGREITITRLREGDPCLMGASCVLRSIAIDALMEAERESHCIVIAPQALDTVFEHNLVAENWSLNKLVDRLSDIMWTFQQTLFTSVDQRLAAFLYEESARSESDTIQMTQNQIAHHLGSAREVVSRMLTQFSEAGIVEVGRGRVAILDRARLREMAVAN